MLEESAPVSIIPSRGLIASRSQTIYLRCNYVEELKTDSCHSTVIQCCILRILYPVALFISGVLNYGMVHAFMHVFAHEYIINIVIIN